MIGVCATVCAPVRVRVLLRAWAWARVHVRARVQDLRLGCILRIACCMHYAAEMRCARTSDVPRSHAAPQPPAMKIMS